MKRWYDEIEDIARMAAVAVVGFIAGWFFTTRFMNSNRYTVQEMSEYVDKNNVTWRKVINYTTAENDEKPSLL